MIQLAKLNRAPIFVNPDLIRYVESAPDTIITFLDGQNIVVLDSPDEIRKKIIVFKRECFSDFKE